jgi:hypothetical protein
MGKL